MPRVSLWRAAALALAALLAHPASAWPAAADMFTDTELRDAEARYELWLRGVFAEDMRRHVSLPRTELQLRLDRKAGPVGVWTDGSQVVVTTQALRFLDELGSVAATLDARGCSRIALLVYAAKIQAVDLARAAPPGPMEAFGLNAAIYKDKAIKDGSNKQLNSMVVFVLAHELGHVARGHVGKAQSSGNIPLEQEADAFALDVMASMRVVPTGVLTLFQVLSLLEGYPATHPLSGTRLKAVAADMARRPAAFVDTEADSARFAPLIRDLGSQISQLATRIDQPGMRGAMAVFANGTPWRELKEYAANCTSSPILRRLEIVK